MTLLTTRDVLAKALCLADDTMFHHERTDDFPCAACKRTADALLASGAVVEAAAVTERIESVLSAWRDTMAGDAVRESVVRGMSVEIRAALTPDHERGSARAERMGP